MRARDLTSRHASAWREATTHPFLDAVREGTLLLTIYSLGLGLPFLMAGLGLGVVAEGVETAEQLERLLEMGCGSAQGYYFARPLAKEAASDLLTAQPQQA